MQHLELSRQHLLVRSRGAIAAPAGCLENQQVVLPQDDHRSRVHGNVISKNPPYGPSFSAQQATRWILQSIDPSAYPHVVCADGTKNDTLSIAASMEPFSPRTADPLLRFDSKGRDLVQ